MLFFSFIFIKNVGERIGKMLFEDEDGNILASEEVDELSFLEIDERNLHVYVQL